MLLERPWQYNRDVVDNIYFFIKDDRKITLALMRRKDEPKASKVEEALPNHQQYYKRIKRSW